MDIAKRLRMRTVRPVAPLVVLLALVLSTARPAPAVAQTCHGTLAPVPGVAGDARFAIACDGPIPGQYELEASNRAGEPVDGTPHGLGQGFACASDADLEEAEEDEDEDEGGGGPASSWVCASSLEQVGGTITGSFATETDVCAAGLSLWVVFYETAEDLSWPAFRTALSVACPSGGSSAGGGGGGHAPAPKGPSPRARLTLAALRLSRTTLRPAAGVSARVGYTLSASARTTFVVERLAPGVRRGPRCLAPKRGRASGGARRCTRLVRAARFVRDGAAGHNSFVLSSRGLAAGSYVLLAVARASGLGSSETARSPRFRVVR